MDWRLVAFFLILSGWLYVSLLFALVDWRWNLGRISQGLVCAGATLWILLERRDSPAWFVGATVAFLLMLPGGAFCRRRAVANLVRGRPRRARIWLYLYTFLTWTWHPEAVASTDRIAALMRRRIRTPEGRRRYEPLPAALMAAPSRGHFVTSEIEALAVLKCYAEVVSLYDARVGPDGLAAEPSVFYTVSVACAELGDLERAAALVRRGDAWGRGGTSGEVRRLIACARIFAYAGRTATLERVLARSGPLLELLPPAFPHLWRGVARLRAGEAQGAREQLARALGEVGPGEELLRETVLSHLRAAEGGVAGSPPALTTDLADALDALEFTPGPRARAVLLPGAVRRGGGVTYGLIALCVVVWFLMSWTGASTNGFTLMRFGANVPQLVRHGEWWRLVSSIFVHVGWLHLLFNCYGCYLFGRFVERIAGRWGLFTLFLLSGIGGSATSAFLGTYTMSAGASGAVFGLLGAALALVVRLRGALPPVQQRTTILSFLFLAALSMGFGFLEPRIDNLAHAGGFAVGAIGGAVLRFREARGMFRLGRWLVRLACAAVFLLAAAAGADYAISGGYPRRIPPMRAYRPQGGAWRVALPVFWEPALVGKEDMGFRDPLGPALYVASGTGRVAVATAGRALRKGLRRAGSRLWEEWAGVVRGPDGPDLRAVYRTRRRGRWYLLEFRAPLEEGEDARQALERFQPLLDSILKGFALPAEPITASRTSGSSGTTFARLS